MRYLLITVLVLLTACGGNTPPEAVAEQWADAVVQQDWATTQRLSGNSDLVYALWHGAAITLHRSTVHAYRMTGQEPAGTTTKVRFEFQRDGNPYCTAIYIDEHGKVLTPHIFWDCGPMPKRVDS